MVHEKVHNTPLPTLSLLFEGSTYDLGWDGQRQSGDESPTLPTSDYALFLINAVKFQCGQLFHLFDERSFMTQFSKFHESERDSNDCSLLWYIHYLFVLAFGKAFVVRTNKGRCPPGGDLFAHAMKILPDITYLCTEPLQSIEILCCAALYLQCLDSRSAAYNLVSQF
jgi:proline utilization trans-activator